jgi:hypothetical protein
MMSMSERMTWIALQATFHGLVRIHHSPLHRRAICSTPYLIVINIIIVLFLAHENDLIKYELI